MSSFRDIQDNEWDLELDAPMIDRIRRECDDQNFLKDDDLTDGATFHRLQLDPVLLCRVIYVLCDKQRRARSMTEETFYKLVIGEAIDRATDALLETIVFFTPTRKRKALEAAIKQQELREEAIEEALKMIHSPGMRAKLRDKLGDLVAELAEGSTPQTSATGLRDS